MTDYTIAHAPRISRRLFRQALINRKSPAAKVAEAAYAVCLAWGVDPAVALAFYVHESSAGTKGVAATSLNWGNLRIGRRAQINRETAEGRPYFAFYTNWLSSLDDFCELLRSRLYEGDGRKTVREVLPRFAPALDRNDPTAYADFVNRSVETWERLSRKAGELP